MSLLDEITRLHNRKVKSLDKARETRNRNIAKRAMIAASMVKAFESWSETHARIWADVDAGNASHERMDEHMKAIPQIPSDSQYRLARERGLIA